MKFFYAILLLMLPFGAGAQYADQGSGALRNHVWWFNWGNTAIIDGATNRILTPDGIEYTVTLSNVSGPLLETSVMDTWGGAVLNFLYDFSDANIKPAIVTWQSMQTARFTMTVAATRNGVPVPFTLVGADAEGSAFGEATVLTSDGPVWNNIELFKNSTQTNNPVAGCGTNSIEITETYGGSSSVSTRYGQNPLMAARSATGAIRVNVSMERRQPRTGNMAVAFGVYAPYDRGDLPASYGDAMHELRYNAVNACAFPLTPSLQQVSSVYIGQVAGDADGTYGVDDNVNGVDEEGVPVFPDYNSTGEYTLDVNVTNTSGADAYLSGWFDHNRNGLFEGHERQTVTVPPNATTATLTWRGLPYTVAPELRPELAFRFRISSDPLAVEEPAGIATDGEVEDYFVPILQVCLITKVNAGSDQSICLGESAQLSASGALTYTWDARAAFADPNDPDQQVTPAATTEYIIFATHSNGCNSKDSVTINVMPRPTFTVPSNTQVCEGTEITFTANGTGRIEWLNANDDLLASGNSYVFTPSADMLLRVVLASPQCLMSDTLDVPIVVHPMPQTSVTKSNDINCANGRTTLMAYGGTSYAWYAATGITDPSQRMQFVSPEATQKYYVAVTNLYGCTAIDSTEVTVSAEGELMKYHLPNAFTPNGDGRNDCFGIRSAGQVSAYNMTIYDRWGRIMFQTKNIYDCWDGTHNGVPLDIATFVYVITIDSMCGRVERRGTVTLIR